MLNRAERKSIKARLRWKAYRLRRAVNRNIKERHKKIKINADTLKLWHKEGYPVQLAPRSKKWVGETPVFALK